MDAAGCQKWVKLSMARAKQARMIIHAGLAYERAPGAPIVRPMCFGIDRLADERVYGRLRRKPLPHRRPSHSAE
jgi:hypothetical protein